ncbi:MAG: fibronectin type III domain-containing protein, partial [Candidatus Hydrogenedentes bacterium]|nr:fibronectin type III domain-containing protein [Candidatus Hydrogenedentota bacterium]
MSRFSPLCTVFLCLSLPAAGGAVERNALWPGLDDWVRGEGRGFAVCAVDTEDWRGFVSEGNRIRGEQPGDGFTYRFTKPGTFYLGVILVDDPDGTEHITVTHKGRELGTIIGDQSNGKALYSFSEPIHAQAGDALRFDCKTFVGCYRIYDLLFAAEPILPPAPSFKYIETWCPEPGTVDICWTTTAIVETGHVEYGLEGFSSRTGPDVYAGRNHHVRIGTLDPGREYQGRIVTAVRGERLVSAPFRFRAAYPLPPPTRAQSIALRILEPGETARQAWPATAGIPFARGALATVGDLRLFDAAGAAVPVQAACTCRWPDGSVKWATLTFPADTVVGGDPPAYRLEAKPDWPDAGPDSQAMATITETPEAWAVRTGALAFSVAKNGPGLFTRVAAGGAALPEGATLELTTDDGRVAAAAAPDALAVDENGPCRLVLRWSGAFVDAQGDTGWAYCACVTAWRGMPALEVDVSVYNNRPDPPFAALRSLSVTAALDAADGLEAGLDPRALAPVAGDGLRLLQDKDNHFVLEGGGRVEHGERASGLATLRWGQAGLSVAVPGFWQAYPKGLAVGPDALRIDLLPTLDPATYDDEDSTAWFGRLYPWFKDGAYLFRAGQLTR